MLKVGLTGGIAAGKSVVGEMFAALGAHVIQADEISHQLMQPGEAVYQEVVGHFGSRILNPDGSVNRARLAESAFGTSEQSAPGKPARVEELNQIVHPAVIRRQKEWMAQIGGTRSTRGGHGGGGAHSRSGDGPEPRPAGGGDLPPGAANRSDWLAV